MSTPSSSIRSINIWYIDLEEPRSRTHRRNSSMWLRNAYRVVPVEFNSGTFDIETDSDADIKIAYDALVRKIIRTIGGNTDRVLAFITSNGRFLNGMSEKQKIPDETATDDSKLNKRMDTPEKCVLRHILQMNDHDYITVMSKISFRNSRIHSNQLTNNIHNVRHVRIAHRDFVRNSYSPPGTNTYVTPLFYHEGIWDSAHQSRDTNPIPSHATEHLSVTGTRIRSSVSYTHLTLPTTPYV